MTIIIKILVIENDSQTHKIDKIKLLIHSQSSKTTKKIYQNFIPSLLLPLFPSFPSLPSLPFVLISLGQETENLLPLQQFF